MKTKNSLVYSVSYENYQNKILHDKENMTQGSWDISKDMVSELKYAYVYLTSSEKMIVKKYEIEEGALENLNNDFPLFRYADILLMKAECAVRNGGPGAGDQWIQDVRDRASAGPTSGFGLDEILAERGRELFCEGHRRQDLIRFGKFGNSWWEKPVSGAERTTFPIPQWAIDANPNLGL